MNKFKQIIFTGGGSGGHVVPALTLINAITESNSGTNIFYVGGIKSVERKLVTNAGIRYHAIQTGKLRRYFSLENLIDFFRFIFGILQAFFYLLKFRKKETLIFSTGGFVGLPLVIAGGFLGFEIYIHEQTSRVGLANKIASRFASKIFISFEESKKFFPESKTMMTGYPLKESCFTQRDIEYTFEGKVLNLIDRPILLVTGGGNGAKLLNDFIKNNLNEVKSRYFIIHQVGEKFISEYNEMRSEFYYPVAFLENLIEVMKHAKIIISRAGAGTVMELMALQKKSIFIPLKIAQKNEQYHNAMEASKMLGSIVITEDELKNSSLKNLIELLAQSEGEDSSRQLINGVDQILREINYK